MNKVILLALFIFSCTTVLAQQKKAPAPAPSIKNCHLPSDTAASNILSLEEIKAWADSTPLTVQCAGGKKYSLVQFTISVIKNNPMQTLDFGIGNNGIPLMARKAIDRMGPLDTILLREITGKDEAGKESRLSTIVFKVKSEDQPLNPSK